MPAAKNHSSAADAIVHARTPPAGLPALYAVVRAATRVPQAWGQTARRVATGVREVLPEAHEVVHDVPAHARAGHDHGQILHVEPDGSFSVVAALSRPGQATSIHDHTTWCVVAVVAGTEFEERFRLHPTGSHLEFTGSRTDHAGNVTGFAPPGDIHRVTNSGTDLAVALHIYGTDLRRIGNSVRRVYRHPIR